MKHILVPTDFTIRSLQTIQNVADHFHGEPVRITLFHLLDMPTGIGDLLFRSSTIGKQGKLIGSEFKSACEIIQNKYQSSITDLRIEFGRGNTAAYLSNAFEGLKIDAVFIQANMQFTLPDRDSVDMIPLIYKTRYKVVELPSFSSPSAESFSITDLVIAGR